MAEDEITKGLEICPSKYENSLEKSKILYTN